MPKYSNKSLKKKITVSAETHFAKCVDSIASGTDHRQARHEQHDEGLGKRHGPAGFKGKIKDDGTQFPVMSLEKCKELWQAVLEYQAAHRRERKYKVRYRSHKFAGLIGVTRSEAAWELQYDLRK